MELVIKAKNRYIIAFNEERCNMKDQEQWCEDTYGPSGSRHGKNHRWRLGWAYRKTFFHFRSRKDATWFMMKWS